MADKKASDASIISIIRDMVKAGESEEAILANLKQLGVSEKDAKKLLLLGEADTFALLQSEINKMVKEYYDNEKPELAKYIQEQISKKEDEMTQRVENRALNAFKEDQKFIENQASMFQARVNQSVKNIMQLNDEIKRQISNLGNRISNNEREMWGIKDRIYGSKAVRLISMILIALEVGLIIGTGFLFFSTGQGITLETTIAALVIAAVLATMVFFARLKL